MNIDTPLRELGPVDIADLREVILAQEDIAWDEDEYRQDEYEVHVATKSIVMIFVETKGWPDIEVTQEAGWNRLADVALPLMNDIIERHYSPGGTVIRAMAAKLLAGRILHHIGISTHPFIADIAFMCRLRPILACDSTSVENPINLKSVKRMKLIIKKHTR